MALSSGVAVRTYVWIAGGSILFAATAWSYSAWKNKAPQTMVPKELTVEALRAGAQNPAQARGAVFDALRREDLTEEQRRQAFANMREVWQSVMEQRVHEFLNASTDEEKNAVLDRHIDQMQEWRKAMEERRNERDENERDRPPRGMFGPQTQQERKAQSESRDPNQTAQRMAYFSAMQTRMEQRGITMPFGPRRGAGRGGGP